MGSIAIPIPPLSGNQDIEVDIRVNGELKKQNFRVEVFFWKDCKAQQNRAECIREILSKYDKDWQLYYIGMPTDEFVPITFMKKSA
ncbi:hypothetical protein OKW21_003353 [Catalinimonas alkaloidigena]|uniref:hypothetical protein n=1 Tax=Catalinimonas alkaloidigena TaxID=1075417 RepID=UPI002406F357|nr:hypothetical protein [Catalinimonas alkaloidigena]MDF9798090.1 hypothetical protein [Catalinimonas alkaloidigena]